MCYIRGVVLVIAIAIGVGVAFGLVAIGFQLWVLGSGDRRPEPDWSPGGWSPAMATPPPRVAAAPWVPKPAAPVDSVYDMEDFDKW